MNWMFYKGQWILMHLILILIHGTAHIKALWIMTPRLYGWIDLDAWNCLTHTQYVRLYCIPSSHLDFCIISSSCNLWSPKLSCPYGIQLIIRKFFYCWFCEPCSSKWIVLRIPKYIWNLSNIFQGLKRRRWFFLKNVPEMFLSFSE